MERERYEKTHHRLRIVVENISDEVGYVNPLLRGFCFFSGTLRPQRRSTPLLEHLGSSASTRSLARSLSSYGVPTKHLFRAPQRMKAHGISKPTDTRTDTGFSLSCRRTWQCSTVMHRGSKREFGPLVDFIKSSASSDPSRFGSALTTKGWGERRPNMRIIGVDYHPSVQQIAWVDRETGECGEERLAHCAEAE